NGQRVRDHLGLVGEWTHLLDGFRQFNIYFQSGRLSYPTQPVADVDRTVVGGAFAHQTAEGGWGYGGVLGGRGKPGAFGRRPVGTSLVRHPRRRAVSAQGHTRRIRLGRMGAQALRRAGPALHDNSSRSAIERVGGTFVGARAVLAGDTPSAMGAHAID